ncbi:MULTISPECIES: ATP-dependent DNA helicase [unclassified Marinobacterium]|uniref:ATP-dependent DNA helicase n=1 Tax=unclassified Marinobacterium TaxID=2644139 RepID=UPI001567C775|nr:MULTISPECIES: ATP-dependent DNA helicase [unclassified Marinobacterium]NRP48221.1 ATP-dependent DNA helicase DinG [Marinobacterium sp. xm-d-543]NRQ24341.1 ATP-dependent DNA helicase DinG [Marinobacterium sp. xm-m-312]
MRALSVRTLCEFCDRSGDIDLRYTPAPTALEGIQGHKRLQMRRPKSYIPEFPVAVDIKDFHLKGRADGWDPSQNRVEEIKTHRGDLERQSTGQRQLHLAQLRSYGAMLCMSESLHEIHLRLSYLEIASDEVTHFDFTVNAAELIEELKQRVTHYQTWQSTLDQHRAARQSHIASLVFPFPHFRKGQRELAEAVYKANNRAKQLLIEAPTGSGKTLGTLFPAIKALQTESLDSLYYLTTRNTARRVALDAFELIQSDSPIPLSLVEMTSKEAGCIEPDKLCQGDSCPLAKGFFDRLPAARDEAFTKQQQTFDQTALQRLAKQHSLCPYFLGQELARWADIVVADINQFLAPSAILYGYLVQDERKVSALVDESHNLISRCRDLYSLELRQIDYRFDTNNQDLQRALDSVQRAWQQLFSDRTGEQEFINYLPETLENALQKLCSVIGEELAMDPSSMELQNLLFASSAYLKLAEQFGEHSIARVEKRRRGRGELAILNMDPSLFLVERWQSLHSLTMFSATLKPFDYYQQLLGLNEPVSGSLPSPFEPDQIRLTLRRDIDTRYQFRARSIQPIAELLVELYHQNPGNHLFFSSSFSYLNEIEKAVAEMDPDIDLHPQRQAMSNAERQDFLDAFSPTSRKLGLAVLGGLFSEGVDLPGDRLIGVTVATLGLPPFDEFHDLMRNSFDERFGKGYEYTYLYPGLQKVIQACGRLIRTAEDRGTLTLIDPRFASPEIQAMLPSWWPSPHLR